MNKNFTRSASLAVALLLGGHAGFAQLSGVKTIPGSGANTYPSLSAAIADLNVQGVGAGGVTFNIAANYTETLTAPLSMTVLATGTAGNPIIFQKSGVGANPIITTYTGGISTSASAIPDGIWNLQGSDYVTIDGINIQENAANTTAAAMMEYGFGLFKQSATNGAQHNTIQNCVITLNRNNVTNSSTTGSNVMPDGSVGILVTNSLASTATTASTPTAATGTNSYNQFYANTIQNTNIGIALSGYAASSPYATADVGNDIGGSSPSTGNLILNFGGGDAANVASNDTLASGILARAQYSLNASYNTINSNNGGGVTHNTSIHGIYLRGGAGTSLTSATTTAGATLNNNTITLARNINLTTVAAGQRMAGIENGMGAGASSSVTMNNNQLLNCSDAASTSTVTTNATFLGLQNNAAIGSLNIDNNSISGFTSSLSAGTFSFASNSPGGAVVNSVSMSKNTISNIAFNETAVVPNAMNLRIIVANTVTLGANCIWNADSNSFSNISFAAPQSGGFEGITTNQAGTSASATVSASGNNFSNINIPKTGGLFSLITLGNGTNASSNTVNLKNNVINNVSAYGTGTYQVLGVAGNQGQNNTESSNINITGNTIHNLNNLGGSGGLVAIQYRSGTDQASGQLFTISGNVVDSVSSTSTTSNGNLIGISTLGGKTGSSIFNNTISRLYSNGTGTTDSTMGIRLRTATTLIATTLTNYAVYGNIIDSISSSNPYVMGINQFIGGTNMNYYKNKINNISGIGSNSVVAGLNILSSVAGTSGTPDNYNIYNNLIGNLTAPVSVATGDVIRSINLPSTVSAFTNFKVSNNTLYLNANSTNPAFNCAGIFAPSSTTATSSSLWLVNNVIVNNTTTGSGSAVAFRRSTTDNANFNTTSDNNLFYGTTGLYSDGTNNYTTLSDYHAAFIPQGLHSVSENVAFLSTSGSSPDYLKPISFVATAIENGGKAVSGITDDYYGTTRNATTPDLGAIEGNYTMSDHVSPSITFTPLTDTIVSAFRNITAFATITDASNVNTATGFMPRLYFKKNSNNNVFLGNTSSDNGWKYVEASNTTSPFSFNMDYSLLQGVLSLGDSIQYFVMAQDMAPTVNAGPNNAVLVASSPTVALNASQNGVTGAINSFAILASLNGIVTVGTSGTYNSLTNAGGLFDALNTGIVTGNITAIINSDLTNETGAVSLGPWTESGAGNYNLNIVPDGTTERMISGTVTGNMVALSGADRVTINGSYNGSGKYLRFRNSSNGTTATTFSFNNDAKNDTIANCTIEGGGTSSGAVVYIGTSAVSGATGNDNIAIMNNLIRDISTTTAVPSYLVRGTGTSGATNDNILVYNNEFMNWTNVGTYISSNSNNWTMRKNAYYQTATRTTGVYGIQITTGSGHIVDSNSIGGSAADRSGAAITTSGATMMGINVTNAASATLVNPIIISNNNISKITSSTGNGSVYGINVASFSNIYGNKIGRITSADSIASSGNTGTLVGILASANTNIIRNNSVAKLQSGSATTGNVAGIYITGGTCLIDSNSVDSIISLQSSTNFNLTAPTGIMVAVAAGSNVISNNKISNIINGNTSTANACVQGMLIYNTVPATAPFKVFNNNISNIYGLTTSTSGNFIAGIDENGQGLDTFYNNQVNIGTGVSSGSQIRAIYEQQAVGTNHTYLNNTVVLTGVTDVSAGRHTEAFTRQNASIVTLKNNIFANLRTTTGTGTGAVFGNYAIFQAGASAANLKSDYNLISVLDSNKVSILNSLPNSYSAFKTLFTSDTNTVMGNVPFVNIANNDLHIDVTNPDAWNVYGRGMAHSLVTTDINGNVRSTTVGIPTTIGANEIAAPSVIPADMVMTPAVPTLGIPTVFTSAGRKIAEITWLGAIVPTVLSAKYYPGVQAPNAVTSPNINSYFDITSNVSTSVPYSIKAYYTDAEAAGIAHTDLVGMKSHTSGSWTSTTALNVSALDLFGQYLPSLPLTDFSTFSMTGNSTPLAISVKTIAAQNVGNRNRIDWSTATENKADRFELESSTDARIFNKIANINAKGQASVYTYWDEKPAMGMNYYRLKMTLENGSFIYSNVVKAEVKSLSAFTITAYPNPVQQKLGLNMEGNMMTNAVIIVTDVTGKTLQTLKVANHQMDIDMNNFATGIYFIKYSDDQQTQTLKVNKQ